MTTQTATPAGVEERLAGIENRMGVLEAIMTSFIEEQREYRREINARFDKIEEDQREYRREVNARFDKMEREVNARFDKMEESQREHAREINSRLATVEGRTDRVADRVTNLMLTVLGIVGTLSIAVIIASISASQQATSL